MTIDKCPVGLRTEEDYRKAALFLCCWAVRFGPEIGEEKRNGIEVHGRLSWDDERAAEVTENRKRDSVRQSWPSGYSSCGDLVHWLYESLGVRSAFVNREAIHPPFRFGGPPNNLSLVHSHPDYSRDLPEQLSPGDVLYVGYGSRDHVCVVLGEDAEGEQRTITTADYGQSLRRGLEGRAKRFRWDRRWAPMMWGGAREVHGFLSLARVIDRARAEDELVTALIPTDIRGDW